MKKRIPYFIIALITLALDQLSKIWVQSSIYFGDRITLIQGFLNIIYVENSGGAFGVFSSLRSPYKVIIFSAFSLGAIVLILYYLIKYSLEDKFIHLGLAFILSGATGNFIDRLRLGYVIDFINLHIRGYHWPTFNFADSAICIGLVLIIISYIKNPPKEKGKSNDVS